MSATEVSASVVTTTDLGATIIERSIPGLGLLRFEEADVGQWLTKKGEPARKAKRVYTLNGDELVSVSSVVGVLSKEALMAWHEDMGARGAIAAHHLGELDDVPDEDIIKRVRLLNLGAAAKRDEGADRGKAIHAAFESLARTGEPPDPSELPGEWRPWLRGAVRAWLAMNPDPLHIEEIVCNPLQQYAGRFDLIANVDGRRLLIDYKTGKGRVYPESMAQTGLYRLALEPSGIEDVEGIIVVGVDDGGGFELVTGCAHADELEALLTVARARRRWAAQMATDRKAAKAVTS